MTSWVYIFSKFTPEALLLEGFIILLLCCGYAAFWILRKRKYGVADTVLPTGPVKSYLNELIVNAEQLRLQLFGLLSTSEYSLSKYHNAGEGMDGSVANPEVAKKMALLETKMTEQTKALESLTQEKLKLESDLSEARAASQVTADGSLTLDGNNKDEGEIVGKLKQKVQELEGKLAEYSVIEDDLANLKRLQQENSQLKSLLNSKGIAITPSPTKVDPAPSPSAVSPEPPSATSTPAEISSPGSPATESSAAESSGVESVVAESTTAEPSQETAVSPETPLAETAQAPTASPKEAHPSDTAPPAAAAPPPPDEPSPTASPSPSPVGESTPEGKEKTASPSAENANSPTPAAASEKSESSTNNTEADLVAEFEKMLKN